MAESYIGHTIVEIRKATDKEVDSFGVESGDNGGIIILSNGAKILASQDTEGNGCGCLFGKHKGKDHYLGLS
jgi:hypothetical protein